MPAVITDCSSYSLFPPNFDPRKSDPEKENVRTLGRNGENTTFVSHVTHFNIYFHHPSYSFCLSLIIVKKSGQ